MEIKIDIPAFVLSVLMFILVMIFAPIWAICGIIYVPFKVAEKVYKDFRD